jgi:uncharacterized phosphosugar-binding protein
VSRCRDVVLDVDLSCGDSTCSGDEVDLGACYGTESERVGIIIVDSVLHSRFVLSVEDDATGYKVNRDPSAR